MTSAPGTKKKTAASTHRLMEEVPLWPAAAIQRGPSTVAMLNSSTSQKPMDLRSCDLGLSGVGGAMVMKFPAVGEELCGLGNDNGRERPGS
jgi:predicted component of type VI protein secretion system